jgi:hypothetical protein
MFTSSFTLTGVNASSIDPAALVAIYALTAQVLASSLQGFSIQILGFSSTSASLFLLEQFQSYLLLSLKQQK